jgi:hypothetical protein
MHRTTIAVAAAILFGAATMATGALAAAPGGGGHGGGGHAGGGHPGGHGAGILPVTAAADITQAATMEGATEVAMAAASEASMVTAAAS